MCVAGCNIAVSTTLKTIDVKLDRVLMFVSLVNDIAAACNFHMWALHLPYIRHFLPCDVANTVICSIIGTRIDYGN